MAQLTISIEKAKPEDAETICDIRDSTWMDTYPNAELGITPEDVRLNAQGKDGVFVPRRIAYLKKKLAENDNQKPTTLVAKVDGETVGYIDPFTDNQGRRRIGAIYVKTEFQGQGVGGRLLKAVLDAFGRDQDIYLDVISYNHKAIGFYKHFGFQKTDGIIPDEEGRPDYMKSLPQVEMVLKAI